MRTEKQIMYLEVAYDLIQRVHTYICHTTTHNDNLAEETLEILRKIILLSRKIEKRK